MTDTNITKYDPSMAYGFEETKKEDLIIPRVKVINALSPERIDGIASEGAIINSLTLESVAGKKFMPIKQYYNNIEWNPDRNGDPRIFCRSNDGRIGVCENGTLACDQCKKNLFDNTKKGKESYPTCTAYLNFLGFFEDSPMPVILSFAKTNYTDGKKMLSIAKSMRAAMWNYCYVLESKKVVKDKNSWYNIVPKFAGESTLEQRELAFELFRAYSDLKFTTEYEDAAVDTSGSSTDAQMESEIG